MTLISRIFPHPLLSLALCIMWLLLTSSLEPRSILFGSILGIFVPFALRLLDPEKPKVRKPLVIIRLCGIVLKDIIRSNMAVMSIIMGRKGKQRVSGFIHIPLRIESTYALATLAIILTCTPGTLWVQYDTGRKRLLLHVLDLVDEQSWVDLIQNRYERHLMEIFE